MRIAQVECLVSMMGEHSAGTSTCRQERRVAVVSNGLSTGIVITNPWSDSPKRQDRASSAG